MGENIQGEYVDYRDARIAPGEDLHLKDQYKQNDIGRYRGNK